MEAEHWQALGGQSAAETAAAQFRLHSAAGPRSGPVGELSERPYLPHEPDRDALLHAAAPGGRLSGPGNAAVLSYATAALPEGLELSGPVILRLFSSTGEGDMDFACRLSDVAPDGTAADIAEGFGSMRAQYRSARVMGAPLEADRIYKLNIDMGSAFVSLARSHRLRVCISAGCPPGRDAAAKSGTVPRGRPPQSMVYHSATYPSALLLTIKKDVKPK